MSPHSAPVHSARSVRCLRLPFIVLTAGTPEICLVLVVPFAWCWRSASSFVATLAVLGIRVHRATPRFHCSLLSPDQALAYGRTRHRVRYLWERRRTARWQAWDAHFRCQHALVSLSPPFARDWPGARRRGGRLELATWQALWQHSREPGDAQNCGSAC